MPVSIIIGTRDRTGPGRSWKKAWIEYELGRYDNLGKQVKNRNSKINIIELDGIGHMPQVEDFERYRKALMLSLRYND
jgi:pimeloyl-ACP methyl ester carboxylesterase